MEATRHELAPLPADDVRASSRWLPRWVPSSWQHLADAEHRLFSVITTKIQGYYVDIFNKTARIWTVALNPAKSAVPLVLIHGFAGGVGIWCQNYESLSVDRPVYAFDVLGFARSSRTTFPDDPTNAELEFVESIEDWRKNMKLGKMILCGHSFGGYLAASYALEHPENVRHLILVDPWGFPAKPSPQELNDREIRIPGWIRTVATVMSVFNPLSSVRAAGPWGHRLVRRFRPDLGRRFAGENGDENAFYDYIYHCNAQNPSGETAFKNLSETFGWSKRPMVDRMMKLDAKVPTTFIYGAKSWIDAGPGFLIQQQLHSKQYVQVETIRGAGHHVYADQPDDFNGLVNEICAIVDNNEDLAAADGSFNPPERPTTFNEFLPRPLVRRPGLFFRAGIAGMYVALWNMETVLRNLYISMTD